jgi:hypothetical protein
MHDEEASCMGKSKKPMTAAELQSMGGKARAKALSKAERSAIARKAAKARAQSLTPAERSRIAKAAVRARELKRKGRESQ